MENLINYLYKRNLIFQITKKEKLIKEINKKNISIYCGFDPTNDSLHIGHLILLVIIKKFLEKNIKTIIVIGGTTSIIGDPSFKKKKNINPELKLVNHFSNKISNQIKNILNTHNKKLLIFNNYSWLNSIKLIDFLKKIGDFVKIKYIINKEFIKSRIKYGELNYKEFSYNLLQSYDFLYLNKKYNINLQIGGSDQWGNITSGINLINKIYKKETYGITFPMLTKLDGNKISKSDKFNKVIWLDKKKTSVYNFYQFWINIPDNLLNIYLKYFTNIDNKNIDYLCNGNYKNFILGKKILAKKITKIVHGIKELKRIIDITKILFEKNINELKLNDFNKLYNYNFNLIKIFKETELLEIIKKNKILNTKSEIKNFINQGSVRINKNVIKNNKYIISYKDTIYNKYILLTIGKKNFYLIKWINKNKI